MYTHIIRVLVEVNLLLVPCAIKSSKKHVLSLAYLLIWLASFLITSSRQTLFSDVLIFREKE